MEGVLKKVIVFSGHFCGYCTLAKKLLEKKKIDFEEINIHDNPNKIEKMMKLSQGKKTVPQIFVGDTYIGGFEDLYNIDNKGILNKILKKEGIV